MYGQLFNILVPLLHNIQNQMYYYIWLHLARCNNTFDFVCCVTKALIY